MSEHRTYHPNRPGPTQAVGFGLLGLLFALVPFLDHRAAREEQSPGFTAAGIMVFLYLAALTWYAWRH